MSKDYEYQVSIDRGDTGTNSDVTSDPKYAGRIYRDQCKHVASYGGGEVKLKRREIGQWEVVESTKV